VEFARWMAPMFALPACIAAEHITTPGAPAKVLDVAAGHGMFGIHVALRNPKAEVVFQDWGNVLAVAREHVAGCFAECDRFQYLAGDAFEVNFGKGYDAVLLPNFLHHFDRGRNVALLKKVHGALRPGGIVAVIEFVPNEDRVSPPDGALFAMRMLGTTPTGDAYTFQEIDTMLTEAGFGSAEPVSLKPAHQLLILARSGAE
jgi:ubiquinone/menaquinone biosynthesis C-methylase UbiE